MKVLIVSNTALRKDNANGYLLLTNLSAVDYKDRCSLYIQNALPDKDSASSHFNITDKDRLFGFFRKKDLGRVIDYEDIPNEKTEIPSVGKHKGIKESDFFLFVREFIWKHGKWNRHKLDQYIYDNKPTVIFFLCSRSIFMNNLVVDISKKYSIPVVIYTGEDEYFHTYPFYRIFKNILQRKLKKSYKELIGVTKSFICTQDKLAGLFHDEFNIDTKVIMPSIELKDLKVRNNPNGHFVYVGNMQPNRVYTLIEISKALYKINSNEIIDIYSGDITKSILRKINKLPNVVLHEPVPKEETINIIRSAKVILHFESFRKKDKVLIQNGFSTKIPDSLASGVPFVVVAPDYCGFSRYLKGCDDSVFYFSSLDDLEACFSKCVFDNMFLTSKTSFALRLVYLNHDISKNATSIFNTLLLNQSKKLIKRKLLYIINVDSVSPSLWSGTGYQIYKRLSVDFDASHYAAYVNTRMMCFVIRMLRKIRLNFLAAIIDFNIRNFKYNKYIKKAKPDIVFSLMTIVPKQKKDIKFFSLCDMTFNYLYKIISKDDNLSQRSVFHVKGNELRYLSKIEMKSFSKIDGIFFLPFFLFKSAPVIYSKNIVEKIVHCGGGTSALLDKGPIKKENVILFVGTDYYGKGCNLVIEAFLQIKEHLPADTKLIIIGVDNIQHIIDESILFLGRQKNEDIYKYYKKAKVFVSPTKFDCYGLVFLEAISCGCICVGPNFLEIPNFLEQNGSYLYNPFSDNVVLEISNLIYKAFFDNCTRNLAIKNSTNFAKIHSWDNVYFLISSFMKNKF